MITLRQPLTLEECQRVREWRNDPAVLPMLRTGYKTEAEQERFYKDVICNPAAEHWYYAICYYGEFVGMGGLTYAKSDAEISLILSPAMRGCGLGSEAVDALLTEAKRRGLRGVQGECYYVGNLGFWTQQIRRRPATMTWRWAL